MRFENWPELLDAYVQQHREAAHAWGTHDCALFASGAVLAITGEDPFAEYRGRYSNEAQAEVLLDEAGGFEALCTRLLGEPVPAGLARRGDLVFGPLRRDGAEGLAVCIGDVAVSPGFVWRAETTGSGYSHKPTGRLLPKPGLVFHKLGEFRLAYRID